ncbi:MAG: family 20 glycosylhydrolase [Chitinophagaceae bacterium]
MKKNFVLFCFCVINTVSYCQTNENAFAIIPEPVKITAKPGRFILPQKISISASAEPEIKQVTDLLKNRLSTSSGTQITIDNRPDADISLVINKTIDASIGNEGYRLSVTTRNIAISANRPAGLFYGMQSLIQLFPKQIESFIPVKLPVWEVPCVEITDYPRFAWRGLMFDVSRHFFTKDDVKKFIDDMVRYKYNLLHLHLTDDEGWRIEIKSLPRLTQVGAWNVKKVGRFGNFSPPLPDEPRTYGGFYTQEDIKEIVKYASERFVNILPEIDVPGHSLAAIVSYPDLSCTPGAKNYRVRSGEPIMNWKAGGFTAMIDNTLCPANEKVYEFLDKVVTEVASLFPFEYIHMGGDECAKNFWEQSTAVKALMKKEGLKNMHEMQSYFEKRLEKIVRSKGKKFLGWDEIMEGGLAPGAVVMSWQGMKGGIEAAKMGHEVVMSPTTFAYLDYMQGDPIVEPLIYASLRLNKAYQFEPVPDGVDAKYIKGGQANLWTEQIYNMRHLQYMLWPRAFAIAETLWSPKEKKEWKPFVNRVEKQFERFDVAEINYARSMYDPIFTVSRNKDRTLSVDLATEMEGLDIHYSFDNSFPDRFYPKYSQPLVPPKDASTLKVITYRNNQPMGRMIAMPIKELAKRADRK